MFSLLPHSHLAGIPELWLSNDSLSVPGEDRADKEQIILCGQIPKRRNAWVTHTVALFPWLSLVFHVWEKFQTWEFCVQTSEVFFFYFFLIKTTRLMIKNNTSLASMIPKAQGQNVTSRGIGEDPTATTVFCCQVGPQAPPDQLSLGFCGMRQSRCASC